MDLRIKVSTFFNSKIFPICKKALSYTANLTIFISRFIYASIANIVVLLILLSGIAFGITIVILFGLLAKGFFTSEGDDASNGTEFISIVSEALFSLLAFIFTSIGNFLEYISDNYFLQGLAFFLLFIVVTNKLVKSGIKGFIDKAKFALNGCKKRFIWSFEPLSMPQSTKETSEEE